jgi:hypothetical protein
MTGKKLLKSPPGSVKVQYHMPDPETTDNDENPHQYQNRVKVIFDLTGCCHQGSNMYIITIKASVFQDISITGPTIRDTVDGSNCDFLHFQLRYVTQYYIKRANGEIYRIFSVIFSLPL